MTIPPIWFAVLLTPASSSLQGTADTSPQRQRSPNVRKDKRRGRRSRRPRRHLPRFEGNPPHGRASPCPAARAGARHGSRTGCAGLLPSGVRVGGHRQSSPEGDDQITRLAGRSRGLGINGVAAQTAHEERSLRELRFVAGQQVGVRACQNQFCRTTNWTCDKHDPLLNGFGSDPAG